MVAKDEAAKLRLPLLRTGETMFQAQPTVVVEAPARPTPPIRIVLRCKVSIEGTLKDCQVLHETPAGYGGGRAALRLSQVFKVKPATRDGVPVEGYVTFPITFRMKDGKAPASSVAAPSQPDSPSPVSSSPGSPP